MTYSQAVQFLDSLVNYEKLAGPRNEFKLDNIRRLLELAGSPERRMRSVILVAGTKGKGSVCYMLESALRGCKLSTGMFVSPHVLDVRERIQLDGRPIPKRLFASLAARLAPFVSSVRPSSLVPRTDGVPVSYFEMTTAMAFLLFAERQPDYSVIEVGLGGRLDATNLSDPQISVITRIGYDHLKVLGNTLTKIAGEKAGIMRKGRSVVIGEQEPEALAALKRKARDAGARLVRSESSVSVRSTEATASGLSFRARCRHGAGEIVLPLLGHHQVENCQTALAVLNELSMRDRRIKFGRVARGLGTVSIPARCQVVRRSSLSAYRSALVIVDSCHNPESGRALANVLRDHLPKLRTTNRRLPHPRPLPEGEGRGEGRQSPRVILVYGSLGGKLVEETVAPLAPFVDRAVLVQPDNPRAMPLAELKRVFSRLRIGHVTAPDIRAALFLARQSAICNLQSAMPVVVAGSFYLAGEVLKVLGPAQRRRAWPASAGV
ncbi:bifunctional folylpolyglutamate synthase/dihydrofolate synthase [candidate division WOR-3 bacterium]|uniref:Bifunctional folylpolyglutamate synthase/dihydrofolate synthase n=1 Tax=candidate division WOR-3 bacterium TaxID=2052148 RepID=A0A937XFS4_UNCW3|nr:bifunctional folylpolyglutamate synthase/dihydrofolate synthase [candidate division WOR-3 bacterium]